LEQNQAKAVLMMAAKRPAQKQTQTMAEVRFMLSSLDKKIDYITRG